MISRIHLGLPNEYKLMCFDRVVKFLECDYLLVQWYVKLTLVIEGHLIQKVFASISTKICFGGDYINQRKIPGGKPSEFSRKYFFDIILF